MDDGDGLTFAPARAWSAVFGAVAVAAAVAAAATDAEGRVLAVAVAVAFAALAVADLVVRPRLQVDAAGLSVGRPGGRARFAWDDVTGVAVEERSRLGRLVRTVEIDAGGTLVVLGERALGTDARTAARRIVAAAPPARRAALGGEVVRRGRAH